MQQAKEMGDRQYPREQEIMMNWPLRAAGSDTESEKSNDDYNNNNNAAKKRPASLEDEQEHANGDRRFRRRFSAEERLERRRASNRQSAQRARERAKVTIESLEARILVLEARNRELTMHLEDALLENQQMKNIIQPLVNHGLLMLNRGGPLGGRLPQGDFPRDSHLDDNQRAQALLMEEQRRLSMERALLSNAQNMIAAERSFLGSATARDGEGSTSALLAATATARADRNGLDSSSSDSAASEGNSKPKSVPTKEPKDIPKSLEMALLENERMRAQMSKRTAGAIAAELRQSDGARIRDTLTTLSRQDAVGEVDDEEEKDGMSTFGQEQSPTLRENRRLDNLATTAATLRQSTVMGRRDLTSSVAEQHPF